MKKTDLILIGAALIMALLLYIVFGALTSEKGGMAVVTVDSKLYGEYPLKEDREITVNIPEFGENTFVISDGEVNMTDADCRDHICVKHKEISKNGETIVCLPHKLVIEIKDGDKGDVDGSL